LRSVIRPATSIGWLKYGVAAGALLGAVLLHGVDIGAVEQRLVRLGLVGLDPFDKVVLTQHSRLDVRILRDGARGKENRSVFLPAAIGCGR